nr:putative myosin, putative [Tanacetum cinerariifolium]
MSWLSVTIFSVVREAAKRISSKRSHTLLTYVCESRVKNKYLSTSAEFCNIYSMVKAENLNGVKTSRVLWEHKALEFKCSGRCFVLDFAKKLLLRDADVAYGRVDEMNRLACLNEPVVPHNLKKRYALHEICVRIVLKLAKIIKSRTISTQDQKPQRKAGSGSKFSANNLTMKLNLSKVKV